jgi:ribosomal protein L16 Arg81 hydroxylase
MALFQIDRLKSQEIDQNPIDRTKQFMDEKILNNTALDEKQKSILTETASKLNLTSTSLTTQLNFTIPE